MMKESESFEWSFGVRLESLIGFSSEYIGIRYFINSRVRFI